MSARSRGWLMPTSNEETETVLHRARVFTSLLKRLAEAESLAHRAGHDEETEREAWLAIEVLTGQIRVDLDRLDPELADSETEKGGAQ